MKPVSSSCRPRNSPSSSFSRSSRSMSSVRVAGTATPYRGCRERSAVVVLALAGEELLELVGQLLPAGDRLVLGQQRLGRATREGVVLLLEAGQDVLAVLVGDLLLDLGERLALGGAQVVVVELQAEPVDDGIEQGHGSRWVVDLREVVRHVHDVPGGVEAALGEAVFQQRLHG